MFTYKRISELINSFIKFFHERGDGFRCTYIYQGNSLMQKESKGENVLRVPVFSENLHLIRCGTKTQQDHHRNAIRCDYFHST